MEEGASTEGAGGKMAVQLVAALAAGKAIVQALQSAWDVYSTYETTSNNDRTYGFSKDYHTGYYRENERFWDDYVKRHHLENRDIRYPYRTGYNYNLTSLYSAEAGLRNNALARQGAWISAFTRTARTGMNPSIYS